MADVSQNVTEDSNEEESNSSKKITFADLPLSKETLHALEPLNIKYPSDIQRLGITEALKGYDVIGRSKTGTGKTLAYLITIIEILNRNEWELEHGCGAVILTSNVGLVRQIISVLDKMTGHLKFSYVGLTGKPSEESNTVMSTANIVVGTINSINLELEFNRYFSLNNTLVVAIDEIEIILNRNEVDFTSMLATNRQSLKLLYSATVRRSISKHFDDLKVSNPKFIFLNEDLSNIRQKYILCKLEDKLSLLFSFLQSHAKYKVVVFFNSDALAELLTGIIAQSEIGQFSEIICCAHYIRDKWTQLDIFEEKTSNAVLFTTDLCACGLDFSCVDFVLHLDCPMNLDIYLQRIGKTGRFEKSGKSLLVVDPSEFEFINILRRSNIVIKNATGLLNYKSIRKFVAATVAASASRIFLAKKVLLETVRFAVNAPQQSNVYELNIHEFARSLGLTHSPRCVFTNPFTGNIETLQKNKFPLSFVTDSEDEDDDIELVLKRENHEYVPEKREIKKKDPLFNNFKEKKLFIKPKLKVLSKKKQANRFISSDILLNTHVKFDESGLAIVDKFKVKDSTLGFQFDNSNKPYNILEAEESLRAEDKIDKMLDFLRVKNTNQMIENYRGTNSCTNTNPSRDPDDLENGSSQNQDNYGSRINYSSNTNPSGDPDDIFGLNNFNKRSSQKQDNFGSRTNYSSNTNPSGDPDDIFGLNNFNKRSSQKQDKFGSRTNYSSNTNPSGDPDDIFGLNNFKKRSSQKQDNFGSRTNYGSNTNSSGDPDDVFGLSNFRKRSSQKQDNFGSRTNYGSNTNSSGDPDDVFGLSNSRKRSSQKQDNFGSRTNYGSNTNSSGDPDDIFGLSHLNKRSSQKRDYTWDI